jgi:hypothetical protein
MLTLPSLLHPYPRGGFYEYTCPNFGSQEISNSTFLNYSASPDFEKTPQKNFGIELLPSIRERDLSVMEIFHQRFPVLWLLAITVHEDGTLSLTAGFIRASISVVHSVQH